MRVIGLAGWSGGQDGLDRQANSLFARTRHHCLDAQARASCPARIPTFIARPARARSSSPPPGAYWAVGAAYFAHGSLAPAYQAVDRHVYDRVRAFLRKRHKTPGRGTKQFSREYVYEELGVLWPVGKPDAGKLHVRLDERGGETERVSTRHRALPRLYYAGRRMTRPIRPGSAKR
jgi:hypothetical protein